MKKKKEKGSVGIYESFWKMAEENIIFGEKTMKSDFFNDI